MHLLDIPTTSDGRAIPVEAFELALAAYSKKFPTPPSERQQDAMLELIVEMASDGTTHIGVLADRAVERATERR